MVLSGQMAIYPPQAVYAAIQRSCSVEPFETGQVLLPLQEAHFRGANKSSNLCGGA